MLEDYTSGSTGTPKGVVKRNHAFNASLLTAPYVDHQWTGYSFEPLAHSQRANDFRALRYGAKIGLAGERDASALFDDCRFLRPTSIVAVPRVWDMLYSEYLTALDQHRRANPPFEIAPGQILTPLHEEVVQENFRELFGGKIRSVTTGGAPTSKATMKFLSQLFPVVNESYGSMETGGITSNLRLLDSAQAKLEAVPEMGYTLQDKPHPRGELLVKATEGADGYYKDASLTSTNFTSDGWFRTGDIAVMNELGQIKLIDRRKNMAKLAQGEWISPAIVENACLACPFVEQMWLHVDPAKSFLVGAVVLRSDALKKWKEETKKEIGEELEDEIIRQLATLLLKDNRRPFEVPRALLLLSSHWTEANGLMTPSNKINRKALLAKYGAELSTLYDRAEKRLKEEREKKEKEVASLLESITGKSPTLGAVMLDSLSAVSLASRLRSTFNVDLHPSALLAPSLNPSAIADLLTQYSSNDQTTVPSLALSRSPLSPLDYEVPASFSISTRLLPSLPLSSTSSSILLTGSTGFLGCFLLCSLLRHTNASIICLNRASSDLEAKQRLESSLRRFRQSLTLLEFSRIRCVAGDLSAPSLGLTPAVWSELADTLDAVLHNGAVVNGLLPYERLRDANVESTKECIRLCTEKKLKPLYYVSTLSVLIRRGVVETDAFTLPQETITKLRDEGYPLSKWCSEGLVRSAGQRGLPFMVFRIGTISGDTISGASNYEAYINKLFTALMCLRSYPDINGSQDLIPVNYCADAIVALLSSPSCVAKTFHLSSPRQFSMHTIADLFALSGHLLLRLSYDKWIDKVKQEADTNGDKFPLTPLLSYFNNGFPSSFDVQSSITHATLDSLGLRFPQIDEEIIGRYIQYYIDEKLVY